MLRNSLVLLAGAASFFCTGAVGQNFAPRSGDYLFAATADDARAIWVNPAGLAVLPHASIMGELVFQRPADSDLRVSQLSLGFNSQGLAFGYNRERMPNDSSNHVFRFGLARALQGWTIGVAASYFSSGANDNSFDAGFRYRLSRFLHTGLVVRNLGQPQVRSDTLPLTGVFGVGWMAMPGMLLLNGEAVAQNRLEDSGFDMSYRAGARFSFGRSIPIMGTASVHFSNRMAVNLWTFGISVGSSRRGVLVGDVTPPRGGSARLETVSLAGIATNDLSSLRR